MNELINNCLTIYPMLDNPSALSPHVAVRFCRRKNHKMPLARLILRLRYSMQKIIYGGRYLRNFRLHGSLAISTNSDNVHCSKFGRFKRFHLTFKQQSSIPAQNEQNQ